MTSPEGATVRAVTGSGSQKGRLIERPGVQIPEHDSGTVADTDRRRPTVGKTGGREGRDGTSVTLKSNRRRLATAATWVRAGSPRP